MNPYEVYRQERISATHAFLDTTCTLRDTWIQKNSYYYRKIYETLRRHIPEGASVCHIGCDTSSLLDFLKPTKGLGLCFTQRQKEVFSVKSPAGTRFLTLEDMKYTQDKYDYLIINSLGYFYDIQELLEDVELLCHERTKILIVNYNFLWEPVFSLGEMLGLRMPQPLQRQNMIPTSHIANLLEASNLELVRWGSHILLPKNIPLISWFVNKFLASVFPFSLLSCTNVLIARPRFKSQKPVSVSVIVPCKDEKGNIEAIVSRMPDLADRTEIVFIDDKSSDGTREEMERCAAAYPEKTVTIVDGLGISKGEAVRLGCHAAAGDLLVILDADLAVVPEELPKCILPITSGSADFVNTVRFVYPQQDQAMRWLNVMGNRLFALIFTLLLRQRVNDTLSGTKVFRKRDYLNISRFKDDWIWRDRWGDFEQLLGASRLGLKIMDVPVHYAARTYGETKMKGRLRNGWFMLKLCLGGLWKLRLD